MRRRRKKKTTTSIWQRISNAFDAQSKARLARRGAYFLMFAMVIIGVVVGLKSLDKYVQTINQQRHVKLQVEFINPPAWAGRDLVRDICLSSGVRSDDDLCDKTLVSKWKKNLEANPWIKKVAFIRKCYDGRIRINCSLRRPIASITDGNKVSYVDAEGVVMPALPVHDIHLVKLVGSSKPLPPDGEKLDSKALLAGLEVLKLIRVVDKQLPEPKPLWDQLAQMDVSNFEGRRDRKASHLTLYTKNDTEIRWGAAVGREIPYNEASAKEKLKSLYRTYRQFGSLDDCLYIELRNWRKERSDPVRRG